MELRRNHRWPIWGGALLLGAALCASPARGGGPVLGEERIEIAGLALAVSPAYQAVPRNTGTIVEAALGRPGGLAGELPPLPPGALVQAELRGPAFSTPIALTALPGRAFEIPPLALAGVYTLAGIRLVAQGETLLLGEPEAAQIEVIERVLVSQVSARPLSAQEIREKGIVVDETNFQIVNFTANFGLEDRRVTIDFPMVLPALPSPQAPPAVPAVALPTLQPAALPVSQLPVLETAFRSSNVSVSGLLLRIEEGEEELRGLNLPPLPAVIVIPGNVAFLNQFFSVLLMVANAAPGASQLVVRDLEAEITLPAGRDTLPGTGDDPLRMARLGDPPAEQSPVQPVRRPGPDGKLGTADDEPRIRPGEAGDAEFLVEGRREGGHTVEIEIRGTLDGLPVGPVRVSGRAVGFVEVRNPSFALTLSHPATAAAGEEYELLVTVTNTSETRANFVSLNLLPNSISGARLLSEETQEIETLGPGEAATVAFRLLSQVTGNVVATSFTADDLPGRFELRTAVGALGIPLSPNTLVLPRAADALPKALRDAGVGFLGQGFALATAPVTPKGLLPIGRAIVLERARDLAAGGQRVDLLEPLPSVARDLLLEFVGSDVGRLAALYPDPVARQRAERDLRGLDELLRRSERGAALVEVLGDFLAEDLAALGADGFHAALGLAASAWPPHLSALLEARAGAPPALSVADGAGRLLGRTTAAGAPAREIPFAALVPLGDAGELALLAAPEPRPHRIEVVAGDAGEFDLGLVVPGAAGLRRLLFARISLAAGGRARLVAEPGADEPLLLAVDADGDGLFETELAPALDELLADPGPSLVSAVQILTGGPLDPSRLGKVVALLFSEEISEASSQSGLEPDALTNYAVEGNQVQAAALQPGGRVVLLGLRDGIGPFVERRARVAGIEDLRGQPLEPSPSSRVIVARISGGGTLAGMVRRGDGRPVPFARLRLLVESGTGVSLVASVKDVGADGRYSFDFAPVSPLRLEASDPESGDRGEVKTALRFDGQHLDLDVLLLGSGSLAGRTLRPDGTALAGALIRVTSLTRFGETRGAVSKADGSFAISGIPVGNFTLEAVHETSRSRVVASFLLAAAGAVLVEDLTLLPLDDPAFPTGVVRGQVFRADGRTPAAGIPVFTDRGGFAQSDAAGSYRIEGLPEGPVSVRAIDQVRLEESTLRTAVVGGREITANLVLLGGFGAVRGVVLELDGRTPVPDALVGGGLALVRSGADGSFRLDPFPVGARQLTAVDETGGRSGSTTVTVAAPGEEVDARILIEGRGSLTGRVFDATGSPVANLKVFAIGPRNEATLTDGTGAYRFPSLPLGDYLVSAFLPDFSDGNFAQTKLVFPNEIRRQDVTFRGKGRIRGLLLNASGNPLGGGVVGLSELQVRTATLRPPENTNCLGEVTVGGEKIELPQCETVGLGFRYERLTRTRTTGVTDGTFQFDGVFVGGFDLEAGDRFSGDIVGLSGQIGAHDETLNVTLRFPPNAREIAGTVFQPDGLTPVGAGVQVCLTACGSPGTIEVRTDAAGRFLMQFPFVSGDVVLEARDDAALPPLRGQARASVDRGQRAEIPIRLLGRGQVDVVVRGAAGLVAGAAVELRRGTFPGDVHAAVTDAAGRVVFAGGDAVTEGPFSVSASDPGSGARGFASGVLPGPGAAVLVEVVLPDEAGSVRGRFLRPDGASPIPNAQVRLGSLRGDGFATTDAEGRFDFSGVPVGPVSLEAFDPAGARRGRASGVLSFHGEEVVIDVLAVPQGTVVGSVVSSKENAPVAGADVTLSVASLFAQTLRSTSLADGTFRFPGVSQGDFQISASDARGRSGSAAGRLVREGERVEVRVVIEAPALGRVEGFVRKADGSVPPAAQVTLDGVRSTTIDGTGFYFFDEVPVGLHGLRAVEPQPPDVAVASARVAFDGDVEQVDLAFIGVGSVSGSVRDGAGDPVGFAQVSLAGQTAANTLFSEGRTADAQGRFAFPRVPVGAVSVTARDELTLLAGTASGQIAADGEALVLDVQLEAAAAVGGRVLREDGTPAAGMALEMAAGGFRRFGATAGDGTFLFEDLALRRYVLRAEDPLGTGFAILALPDLLANETLDLGDVVLDERPPAVVAVDPADGAIDVPRAQLIEVMFSEPVDAASVDASALRVATAAGAVAGVWALEAGGTRALFTPDLPFRDFERVTLKVTTAVRDLVGRPLVAEVVSSYVTADATAPTLVSRSPLPGARQVPLSAVVRISYSERVDPAGFAAPAIVLRRGGEVVPGRLSFILGDTVAVLVPDAALLPNSRYEVELAPARDAFGNEQSAGERYAFDTLDTLPPGICALVAPGGTAVRVGSLVRIVADQSCEPDTARVEFFAAGSPAGSDAQAPFELLLPVSGAAGGSLEVAARAVDASGNVGPFASLRLTLEADAPPSISITSPANGSVVPSGGRVRVELSANDDVGVAQVGFQASGAASASRALAVVPPRAEVAFGVDVDVPAAAPAGGAIAVRALALDTRGQASPEAGLTLLVRDATPPALAIASPAAGSAVRPGEELAVRVVASDPSGVAEVELVASGAVAASELRRLEPPAGSAEEVFLLAVPPGATPDQVVRLVARARDAAGNAAETAARELPIADLAPPAVSLRTASGASEFEPGAAVALVVEAADRGRVREVGFDLSGFGGASGAATIEPPAAAVSRDFTFTIPASVAFGESAEVVGIAVDRAGNEGRTAPLRLRAADLTPPSVAIAAPAEGALVVAGEPLEVRVQASDPSGVVEVLLEASGALQDLRSFPVEPPAASAEARFELAVPADAPTGAPIALAARARDAAGNQGSAPAVVTVRIADTQPPEVVSVDPPDGATGVSRLPTVRLLFSEALDPATVDSSSVALAPEGGAPLAASVALLGDGRTVELVPAAELSPSTVHRILAAPPLADRAGNALASPFTSRFTTVSADVTGPRLLELLPPDGAVEVSVAPLVRARFDEPLAPASATPETLVLRDAAEAPVAAQLGFAEGGRALTLQPLAPLEFGAGYAVELRGTLSDSAGNPVTDAAGAPFELLRHAFTTGTFAITAPVDGSTVPELSEIRLEARASPALGVASVVFSVDGAELPPVAAPFQALFTTPAAAERPQLVIGASARSAGGAELTRDEVAVTVGVSLRLLPALLGVPLGGAAELRLVPRGLLREDVPVTLEALDPAVAGLPAGPLLLRAGEGERRVAVTGLAAGSTALVARWAQGAAGASAFVSEPESGRAVPLRAEPVGVSLDAAPSAGRLRLPVAGEAAVDVLLLAQPAAADTPVTVTSSDPAVATAAGGAFVRAGERTVRLEIRGGGEGVAVLRLFAAGEQRELTVVVGEPQGAALAPVAAAPVGAAVLGGPLGAPQLAVAPPVGIALAALPSAGSVGLPVAGRALLRVLLLSRPAAADTPVVVTSRDPAVASVAGAPRVPAGERSAAIEIVAGAEGVARLELAAGDERRELIVVVGEPAGARLAPLPAPPVGLVVLEGASAGTVFLEGGSREVTVRLLSAPALLDLPVVAVSSDPQVATVEPLAFALPAGSLSAPVRIRAGARPGETTLLFAVGDEVATLRVVVGLPAEGEAPVVLAPPVGIEVGESGP